MERAYVLINTDVGTEHEVIEQLKVIPEAVSVSSVYGTYDIVCKFEAESLDKLKEAMTSTLGSIPLIKNKLTLICVMKK